VNNYGRILQKAQNSNLSIKPKIVRWIASPAGNRNFYEVAKARNDVK